MGKKKKEIQPINFIVQLKVYPFDVMVSIGESDEQLGVSLDPYGPLPVHEIENCRYPSDNCDGRYVHFSMGASLIRIRWLPKTANDYGVLAHEILHAVICILDRVGINLSVGISDEAYTYLTGYLTERIYLAINKYY